MFFNVTSQQYAWYLVFVAIVHQETDTMQMGFKLEVGFELPTWWNQVHIRALFKVDGEADEQ